MAGIRHGARALQVYAVSAMLTVAGLVLLGFWWVPLPVGQAQSSAVTRGPYLQMGNSTKVTLCWRTSVATNSRVRYGTSQANLNLMADNAAVTTEHKVTLTSLAPNTTYYYSVGSLTMPLAGGDVNHFFVTAPTPGTAKATRIWVLGDAGTATANQVAVRNAYYAFNGTRYTDLWLMLGDNAYENGTDSEYQVAVFNIYQNVLRQSVLWPTLGNHDTAQSYNPPASLPYYQIFDLPQNAEAGGLASGTEDYYSFDYGNIHFVCLDSMSSARTAGSPMLIWLQNDLALNTKDWLIAFWHHPPYSKGSHDSDTDPILTEMRANVLPILENYGVDLVLCGHSHSYERSYLIDGHYGTSDTFTDAMKLDGGDGRPTGDGAYTKPASGSAVHVGAVYAVAGSSGQISGGPLNHPAMFISLSNLGSLVLDVNATQLDAKFIRETGAVADSFSIAINGPALVINSVTPSARQVAGMQQVKLIGSFPNLSSVMIGGVPAVWSYTKDTSEVTLTTPQHAVGAVNIDLTPTSGSPYTRTNGFAYLPTTFTDNTLMVGATTVKVQHIIELRQAVDALRAVAGLPAAPWTDTTLLPTSTLIKAVHITELRFYLETVAASLGYSAVAYTDPLLNSGWPIKRVHIEELRQRIRDIAGLGG